MAVQAVRVIGVSDPGSHSVGWLQPGVLVGVRLSTPRGHPQAENDQLDATETRCTAMIDFAR
jgi:hypothetical protein